MKKRIAIIGQGTAGSLTANYFSKYTNFEIDWYFSPKIPPQSVGEGTTIQFSKILFEDFNLSHNDFSDKLKGTFKHGIKKINWNGNGNFTHYFSLGSYGVHYTASEFQKLTLSLLHNKINIIPKQIDSYDSIDADYILDCTGKPSTYEKYNIVNSTAVNSAYITQCYWGKPEFDYTLTVARPYGWIFGIPLQNRCSIGYLYDNNINNENQIKLDLESFLLDYNLNPSQDINSLNFKNYYKKNNFDGRVMYNGNASFFLEPLEATSLNLIYVIIKLQYNIINGFMSSSLANIKYTELVNEIEHMLSLHYYAGSKFDTSFWKEAKIKSIPSLNEAFNNEKFKKVIQDTFKYENTGILEKNTQEYGTWGPFSYLQNIKGLGIYKEIKTGQIYNNL